MNQSFLVKIDEVEVRKCSQVNYKNNGKNLPGLKVEFDDNECNRLVFIDKNMDHEKDYGKGAIGTLILKIRTESVIRMSKEGNQYVGEDTKVEISEFIRTVAG